jgi:signal transduction histidine kinase/ligand-binding sensor domain-containing protein/DNA-binding response OmpR family regulator
MKYRITAALIAIVSIICHAQEFRYRHYDVETGLSNNKVNCIYKDSKGLLWIGTPSGLNRFDGYSFRSFFSVSGDTTTLAGSHIESIQEDSKGNLLIGCNGTFSIYQRKTDSFIRNINSVVKRYGLDVYPTHMLIDRDRTIWMHDTYNGAFYITPGEGRGKQVDDPQHLLTKYPISDIVQIESTVCFINKRGNIIAVNAKTHKIQWYDNTIERNCPTLRQQDYSGYCDRQNRLWISSIDGMWVYNYQQQKWDEQLSGVAKGLTIVRAVTQDARGNIWIGQDQCGLTVLNPKTLTYLPMNNTERMGNKTISALYTDNEGNVWIGTYKKGLYQFNEDMFKFNLYDFPDVNCIAEDGGGIVWIGTDSGALIRWNRKTAETATYNDMADSNKPIVGLCTTDDGSVWIGTYRGGLKRFSNGKFTDYGRKNGLTSDNIWAICKAENGCLWLGTLGGGLQHFNPTTGEIITYDTGNSGLIDNYINTLHLSKSGKLYIGTTQGVSVMDVATHKIVSKLGNHDGSKSFSTPNIDQLCEDSRGLLWIATPEGLYIFDNQANSIKSVSLSSGFKSQYVLGLVEDKQGDMWASVGSTIINIKVKRNGNGALTFTPHTYTQSDGLQASDFNQRSFCRMDNGGILVGGLYGINSFTPSKIKSDRRAPKVFFVEMTLFDQNVKVGEHYDGMTVLRESLSESATVNLKYSQNQFTVYFATDSYVSPEKTTYYYRLQGFNSEWMQCPTNLHQATYTNLTPGTYTLEVKAVNNDGTESESVARLEIIIHPPFWLTGWAKVLYVLLILFAIYLIIRYIKRHERKRYIEQKKAEAAKQEEKLAQMKFQFFTNISHELRTPLTLILSPLEAMLKENNSDKQHDRLEIMHNNANRLLHLVNQLLDFRKNEIAGLKFVPIEGDVVSFTKNICDTFSGYSEDKHVQLTYFASCEKLPMLFDGDKLSKILLNLLSNAFKFTPDGGRVDVALTVEGSNLIIKVADTGIGIADADKERIFETFYQTDTTKSSGSGIGLSLVSEYVKLHDGTVKVVDNVGGGSVFIVAIPIRHQASKGTDTAVAATNDDVLATDDKANNKPVALVVDDNVDLQNFLRGELSDKYCVMTASNGRIALEKMAQRQPDIILTDLMMPEMDGIELCRRVKSDEKYAAIPLIVISAKHDEQAKVEGLTLGADDYITKPFNCDLLMLRMKKLIELSHKGVQRTLIEPEPTPIQVTSLDEKLIEAAVKYVEANMDRADLSVEELSRELGMSRVHLYKRMRQVTGKTPTEFIRILRLKRAAQLLRESQLNVSEIAYKVGFNNPKYFSNYFKEEFGVLPSVYQDREGI